MGWYVAVQMLVAVVVDVVLMMVCIVVRVCGICSGVGMLLVAECSKPDFMA